MKVIKDCFNDIISPDNLWRAWKTYRVGKRDRLAALEFEKNLEENLTSIYFDLKNGSYQHGSYYKFIVRDPKRRTISTPSIRDHIVHQAICNILIPYFERYFSPFSFSCRCGRGTFGAIKTFKKYLRQVSQNGHQNCWVLHGDIEKCFDSISHNTLLEILKQRIHCQRTINLLKQIIDSYDSGWRLTGDGCQVKRGIPLGNLTSQLFVNIYLDHLDRFVKEKLLIKKYIRYADDFLIVLNDFAEIHKTANQVRNFLRERLNISFPLSHQRVVSLRQGIEVLGIKFLPGYQKIRSSTQKRALALFKTRMLQYKNKNRSLYCLNASWQSVNGLLRYGCNHHFRDLLFSEANL